MNINGKIIKVFLILITFYSVNVTAELMLKKLGSINLDTSNSHAATRKVDTEVDNEHMKIMNACWNEMLRFNETISADNFGITWTYKPETGKANKVFNWSDMAMFIINRATDEIQILAKDSNSNTGLYQFHLNPVKRKRKDGEQQRLIELSCGVDKFIASVEHFIGNERLMIAPDL